MAYSKFTSINQLKTRFNIKTNDEKLFSFNEFVQPSDWLLATLEKAKRMRFNTEKERSERLVSPVLTELNERNDFKITVYSGKELNVDPKNGLNGECDYILSWKTSMEVIESPIFSLVEAKKNDMELGVAQCAAQMIAAQLFNANENKPIDKIYGCSSTGTEWRFLCLEGQKLTLDIDLYYINEPEKLLTVLQTIFDSIKSNIS